MDENINKVPDRSAIDFVKGQLQNRIPEQNIKGLMVAQGWSKEDVESAFAVARQEIGSSAPVINNASVIDTNLANNPAFTTTTIKQDIPAGSSFSIQKIIIAVVVILCLGIAGFWGYKIYGVYNQSKTLNPNVENTESNTVNKVDTVRPNIPVIDDNSNSVKKYNFEGTVAKGHYLANSFTVSEESSVLVPSLDIDYDANLCFYTEQEYLKLKNGEEPSCFHYITKIPDTFTVSPGRYVFVVIPTEDEATFNVNIEVSKVDLK